MNRAPLQPRIELIVWSLLAIFLVYLSWDRLVTLRGWDPDDQLRLVQLRDFLAGQGWFDNSQHRLNAPYGAPMHWSRLIELPLAGLILILRPLFGQNGAEILAGAIVPLGCYGLIAWILSRIAFAIRGRPASIAAVFMVMVAPAVSMQLRPMRIDHHGWQLVFAALSLWTMFWPHPRRAGLVLGTALAFWMHISLEGAPAAAVFFAFLAMRWIWHAEEAERLGSTVASFAVASFALFFATQSSGISAPNYCDTVSPAHIWAIGAAATAMLPAIYWGPDNKWFRSGAAAFAGGLAGACLILLAPQCLRGAFATMDPIVYKYWYLGVNEGLPVWEQKARIVAIFLGVAIAGLFALAYIWKQSDAEKRKLLLVLAVFQIYAFVLALLVFRTVSVASLFAIPAMAACISLLFEVYLTRRSIIQKIAVVFGMIVLLMPGAFLARALTLIAPHTLEELKNGEKIVGTKAGACDSPESLSALRQIPKTNLVAGFDIGPTILAQTGHSILASSHHRNQQGMRDHIDIFRLPPEQGRAIMARRGITHIVACRGEAEMNNYAKRDPDGLWAQLAKGRVPDWLEKRPAIGNGLQVWRVRQPLKK